jgi:hypothetical protein
MSRLPRNAVPPAADDDDGEKVLAYDPLREADAILGEEFYGSTARLGRRRREPAPKPTHYKIVCISLYTEDIARLDELVAELKRRGHSKANKSAVIRHALGLVDPAKVPKGF